MRISIRQGLIRSQNPRNDIEKGFQLYAEKFSRASAAGRKRFTPIVASSQRIL
jgi:hypothetical protein